MIRFTDVSFSYHGSKEETIKKLSFTIPKGQVLVLCGESGCGKTTVTRLINGLAPEYYEGTLTGKVTLDNRVISKTPIYEIAKKVGSVFQNPRSQFFNVNTTGEIAFGCENIGIEKQEIYKRIGLAATELKIWNLLDRSLFALSGGEKQKIACASVSAMEPEVFVLDEPSSNLDIATIYELKEVIERWKSLGKTVVIAEHRLFYLMDVADRVMYMKNGKVEQDFTIDQFKHIPSKKLHMMGLRSTKPIEFKETFLECKEKEQIEIRDFVFSYGKKKVIDMEQLKIPKGSIIGVIGNNGAGKSTFSKCLCGLEKSAKGTVVMDNQVYTTKQRIKISYMVMQDVNHQLFTESVLDEILLSMPDKDPVAEKKAAEEILERLNLLEFKDLHPMSLSGGQKQRVAIGSAVVSEKAILVFDEPTSGLDYRHMLEVAENLKQLSKLGKTLFIVTHDPELIQECCNYFIYIEDGQVEWSDSWTSAAKNHLLQFFNNQKN